MKNAVLLSFLGLFFMAASCTGLEDWKKAGRCLPHCCWFNGYFDRRCGGERSLAGSESGLAFTTRYRNGHRLSAGHHSYLAHLNPEPDHHRQPGSFPSLIGRLTAEDKFILPGRSESANGEAFPPCGR